jgi:hypothetical protein
MTELIVAPEGVVRCVYGEELDLYALGQPEIRRASSVEPDAAGRWWADLSPAAGPRLGPFGLRSDALAAEVAWLTEHWLVFVAPLDQATPYIRSPNAGRARPDRDWHPVGADRLPGPALRDRPVVTSTPERSCSSCGRPAG